MTPEKVIRDGKVAVLYSPGYGAGWSTWASEAAKMMLFDRRFVEAAERGESDMDKVEALAKEVTGLDYVCVLGWPVKIEWLPEGTAFRVDEYDGYERIQTSDDLWVTA